MVNICINNILDRVFQPPCPLCGTPTTRPLCAGCHNDLPVIQQGCQCCGLPIPDGPAGLCGHCLKSPRIIDQSIIPFRYANPLDHLIGQFKFSSNLAHGRILSQLWLGQSMQLTELPERLVPVPLHRQRLQTRGYNQALELAKPISRNLGIPICFNSCERTRNNPPQAGMNKRQRSKNIRGVFKLTKEIGVNHIALIDDVVTTGSTVTELARLFKRSGVVRVDVWAIARTP